jgi:5-methylcytosine-specific restriction endonuclease McrA
MNTARSLAKVAGKSHYFTGAPCIRGHIDRRQTSNGNCVGCDALKVRDSAGDAAYRLKHHDKVRAANVKWYAANRDRYSLYVRNRRVRMLGAAGTHNQKDIAELFKSQSGACAGCACCLAAGWHVDHVMPLVLGGSNWPSNLQLLCPACNLRKGAKHPDQWRRMLAAA